MTLPCIKLPLKFILTAVFLAGGFFMAFNMTSKSEDKRLIKVENKVEKHTADIVELKTHYIHIQKDMEEIKAGVTKLLSIRR